MFVLRGVQYTVIAVFMPAKIDTNYDIDIRGIRAGFDGRLIHPPTPSWHSPQRTQPHSDHVSICTRRVCGIYELVYTICCFRADRLRAQPVGPFSAPPLRQTLAPTNKKPHSHVGVRGSITRSKLHWHPHYATSTYSLQCVPKFRPHDFSQRRLRVLWVCRLDFNIHARYLLVTLYKRVL